MGLIPAHAGKTTPQSTGWPDPRAHPRSRGENPGNLALKKNARGSSPLTRGKHRRSHRRGRRPGLIPAHAGKTLQDRLELREHAAHPRSRGENSDSAMSLLSASGSSPLTRGKRSEVNCGFLSERLIPAHAGKTTWVTLRCWRDLAHPRSRGENKLIWSPLSPQRGSSPLTRGKRLREQAQQARHGLIPAHAGKTTRGPSVPTGRPAHPRSRGENSPQKRRSPGWAGSSPLTRGKPSRLRRA